MTIEEIKEKIEETEAAYIHEIGTTDITVMDIYPKENVKKALAELGIKDYWIWDDNSVTYTVLF